MQQYAPNNPPSEQFKYGGTIILAGISLFGGVGWILSQIVRRSSAPFRLLMNGIILKSMLALRGLVQAAEEIQTACDNKDLPEARRLVSWHLVSRDTSQLDETQVAAATIESVSENASDGVIAPLFYYALWGLPGAIIYRFANTADAMLGYRDQKREWLGKIPARFDDLLNIIPARLTALFLFAAGRITDKDTKRATAIWKRDHNLTDSPNAGHPMSMAAGLLDVELEKTGQYTLGKGARSPQAEDVTEIIHLTRVATVLAAAFFIIISLFRHNTYE